MTTSPGTFSVPLSFSRSHPARSSSRRPSLVYDLAQYAPSGGLNAQALLRDRLVASPQIDLNDYRAKAVIDWVELKAQTPGYHQAINMQRRLAKILKDGGQDSSIFVGGPDRGKRHKGHQFILRIQQPTRRGLALVSRDLVSHYEAGVFLPGDVPLAGIEVSVDIYPKRGLGLSDDDLEERRWLMTDLLRRHLRVQTALTELDRCAPRVFSDDDGRKSARFVISEAPTGVAAGLRLAVAGHGLKESSIAALALPSHTAGCVDQTYYVGEAGGHVMFRIMDKVTDNRDPVAKTADDLGVGERRSRIEVTLQGAWDEKGGHGAAGFETVDDILERSFKSVRTWAFEFYKPTFGPVAVRADLDLPLVADEKQAFARSGVYGLDRLHRAANEVQWAQYRSGKREGRPFVLRKKGCLVSWAELNQKVDRALRALSATWQRPPVTLGRPVA